uniref:Uncharacterized protein n=1 Tax=Oryza barthii TaxID=65489 RepID=A0A0D3FLD9_9ORYZ
MEAGTTVSVRTRVGKLPGGRQLVLWLSAVVVSAAEEGYLTVVYKGDFPPGDRFQTVRVARKDTKKITAGAAAAAAATITDPAAAAARPSSNNVAAPAPRPSTGGKKVRIQRERRDLDGSKKLAVTAKKCSLPPIQPEPAPTKKSSEPAPPLSRRSASSSTRSPRRERATIASSAASEKITVGMARPHPGGEASRREAAGALVLRAWWSSPPPRKATSCTVLYKGNFPPEDPFKTVRVAAREEAKKMAAPAAAIATSTTALPSGNNAAAPRPTTAGKSVPVLKRVFSEAF